MPMEKNYDRANYSLLLFVSPFRAEYKGILASVRQCLKGLEIKLHTRTPSEKLSGVLLSLGTKVGSR